MMENEHVFMILSASIFIYVYVLYTLNTKKTKHNRIREREREKNTILKTTLSISIDTENNIEIACTLWVLYVICTILHILYVWWCNKIQGPKIIHEIDFHTPLVCVRNSRARTFTYSHYVCTAIPFYKRVNIKNNASTSERTNEKAESTQLKINCKLTA